MSGGYSASVTASLSGASTQGRSRGTSRARAKSLDLGEKRKGSPGGTEGEAEPDEDGIQVARELRLDSDSKSEKAEA